MVTLSKKDKEWITPVTKSLIHERWEAYRMMNWTRHNYLKKKVKKEILKAKSLWADRMKTTQHGLWKLAKMIRHGPRDDDGFEHIITLEGGITAVLQRLALSCSSPDADSQTTSNLQSDDDWNFEVTEEEVFRLLSKLNVKKSSGDERIPTKIYVTLADYIAKPLARIYNDCITQRYFPDQWKHGITIPVPKTKPVDLAKIRKITLLSPLGKILERLILRKAGDCFYSSYGSTQHGFRRHASTTTALIELTHNVLSNYDKTKVSCIAIISFDFSQAFDAVSHRLLIQRLSDCDFPAGLIKLLCSYLCGRSSRIRLRKCMSESFLVTRGVPQGSVLGPPLFCVFTSDFCPKCLNTKLVKYADDLSLVIPFKTDDPGVINQCISEEVEHLRSWCSAKELHLNVDKSNIMFHSRRALHLTPSLPLPTVEATKVLGILFTKQLTWDAHCKAVCKKANQRFYYLRRLKSVTT